MYEPFELDEWAWARAADEETAPDVRRFHVTAVLVTHNGEAWLPEALESLRTLSVRPERLVAVDNGSADASRRILERYWSQGVLSAVYEGGADWGFGQAVARALELENDPGLVVSRGLSLQSVNRSPDAIPDEEWLWLLHDDIAATPGVLGELLAQVAGDPQIVLTGPTLLRPSRRGYAPQIEELGVSVSDTGRREIHLEPGEIEQGQHEPAPTLGVSTCGMLVRRNVFEALGGFDENVPLHRDGVEFGWRANLAGYRVRTCPRAMLIHRSVGRAGLRRGMSTEHGNTPESLDRLLGMRVVAAHRTGFAAANSAARMVVGCLLRSVGLLIGKAPARSLGELRAAWGFLTSREETRRLRDRVSPLEAEGVGRRSVRLLRPPTWSSWITGWETVYRWFQAWAAQHEATDDVGLDELTGDDFAAPRRAAPRVANTAVFAAVVLLASLVSGRALLGLGSLRGGELLPAPGGVGQAISAYLHVAPGQAPGAVPWVGLAALGSAIVGSPGLAVALFVFLAIPLTFVVAGRFLRLLLSDDRLAWAGAAAYSLLPVLAGAINRGQLWLHAWLIVVPLLGSTVVRWSRRATRGPDSWRGPAGAALWLTVLTALLPLSWVAVAFGALIISARAPGKRLRGLVALMAPLLLLAPWAPALGRFPGRLLTGPEPALTVTEPANLWELLLLRTPGPGLPPMWVSVLVVGGLWLLAFVLTPRAARPVGPAWLVSALALGLALIASRFLVRVSGGAARPAITPWLILAVAAALLVLLRSLEGIGEHLVASSLGLRQVAAGAVVLLAAAALLVAGGWWVVGGAAGPIARGGPSRLPAFVSQAQSGDRQARTLAIDLAGAQPRWMLLADGQPTWGVSESGVVLGGDATASAVLEQYVAQIAVGSPDEALAAKLAEFGVGYVWVNRGRPESVSALNSVPGLLPGVADGEATVWPVASRPTRATVRSAAGEVPAINGSPVPAAAQPRTLVLADPADRHWQASLDGVQLRAVESGDWRQAFELDGEAGVLHWSLRQSDDWVWLQLAGLAVLIVLATPSISRTEYAVPRRAGRFAEVDA